MDRGFVAADGAAPDRFATVGKCEWHDEHSAGDLSHHQPVSRRERGGEERIGLPNFVDAVGAERGVLEQVGGLIVDLERVNVVELVKVEALATPRWTTPWIDETSWTVRRAKPPINATEAHGEDLLDPPNTSTDQEVGGSNPSELTPSLLVSVHFSGCSTGCPTGFC